MNKLYKFVAKIFYTFLDISGILLGIFLIALGLWIKYGKGLSAWSGWVVFTLGICAFIIHFSHFTISKKRGSEYFYTTRRKDDERQ